MSEENEISTSLTIIVPMALVPLFDDLAESRGEGRGGLSVRVLDAQGGEWMGCRTWCSPEYAADLAHPPSEPVDASALVAAWVYSAEDNAVAYEHWSRVLHEHGMSLPVEEV